MILNLSWQLLMQHSTRPDTRLIRWTQGCLMLFILTLSFTSTSIQAYLNTNLKQLLGSDLVVVQHQPLNLQQMEQLALFSSEYSVSKVVNITLTQGEVWQSVQLKSVDKNYPLQGELLTSRDLVTEASKSAHGPAVGEVWIDSRLYSKLDLNMGQLLTLGRGQFRLARIIHHEPDRLMEGHSVAMRAMINDNDFKYLSADHAKYRYLINASEKQRTQIGSWLSREIPAATLLSKSSGHPLALFWLRIESFLGLASILLFLMAAIALDQAGRRQLVEQQRFMAICLSMGVSRSSLFFIGLTQWFGNFILALLPSLLLASLAQWGIIQQMQPQFPDLNITFKWIELFQAVALLFILLIIFQLPNWIALAKVTPAQLIRQVATQRSSAIRYGFSMTSIAGVALIYSDNALLTGLTLLAMATTMLLMMLLTWLVLTTGQIVTRNATGLIGFSFYMMKQRLLSKSIQILGVGLCATLLLFTLNLMRDIGATMEGYTREHDGNLLVTQATNTQVNDIYQWSQDTGTEVRQLKPFWYGQLIKVNDSALSKLSKQPSESMASLVKPVRLHGSESQANNNRTVYGERWHDDSMNWQQVSVEHEVMVDLGLKLTDRLLFNIEGREIEFSIVASHEFVPGHGSITFWFNIPNSAANTLATPPLYMGSLEVSPQGWQSLSQLWQRHPSLRLVSVKELTARFDATLAIVIKFVSVFSIMITLLALLVIQASVQNFENDERHKNALLISFGRSRLTCTALSVFEWLVTSFIASGGAIVGTGVAATLIYQSQFGMSYQPDWQWFGVTLITSAVIVCTVGILASRNSLQFSVKQLLG